MKIGLLITARLKSSRLPFKLLKDLNGVSIVERVIQRCKEIRGVEEIVLCTSTNKQDKPLVEVSKSNNIFYYLGSEEDVLKRLSDCAEFFGFDYVLSITGENPLLSIDHANLMIDRIKTMKEDFVYIDGLPIGCAVYGLNVNALRTVCEIKAEVDTEIWGPLINRPEIFSVGKIQAEFFYNRPKLRLTNDYFEDFQFMNAIFDVFPRGANPSLYSVLNLLDREPHLLEINKHRMQLALSEEVLERIDLFFKENLDKIQGIKRKNYKI